MKKFKPVKVGDIARVKGTHQCFEVARIDDCLNGDVTFDNITWHDRKNIELVLSISSKDKRIVQFSKGDLIREKKDKTRRILFVEEVNERGMIATIESAWHNPNKFELFRKCDTDAQATAFELLSEESYELEYHGEEINNFSE